MDGPVADGRVAAATDAEPTAAAHPKAFPSGRHAAATPPNAGAPTPSIRRRRRLQDGAPRALLSDPSPAPAAPAASPPAAAAVASARAAGVRIDHWSRPNATWRPSRSAGHT